MITYEQCMWRCTIERPYIDTLHSLVKIFRFYKGDIRYEPVYYPPPRDSPSLINLSAIFQLLVDKEFEKNFKSNFHVKL